MEERIAEKDYPIERIWVLKAMLNPFGAANARDFNLALHFFVLYAFLCVSLVAGFDAFNFGLSFIILFFLPPFIFYLLFLPVLLILSRAAFYYAIEDQFLVLKQGIVDKQERHLPYGVIQNIFIDQDVLDRIFGIASLIIENVSSGEGAMIERPPMLMGFSGNKILIPGLTKQNAEAVKEIILRKMKENPMKYSRSGL